MLKKIKNKIELLKLNFFNNSSSKRYIKFNKKRWSNNFSHYKSITLVEITSLSATIITQSYLVNHLCESDKTTAHGFVPDLSNWKTHILNRRNKNIYKSFGVSKIHYPKKNSKFSKKAIKVRDLLTSKIKTKKDLEDLYYDDVYIGDLIYDSFLRKKELPTVDLDNRNVFNEFLLEEIYHYLYWDDFFKNNKVSSIIITHCVYSKYAIPLRIALKFGAKAYQINPMGIYKISKDEMFAYNQAHYFDELKKKILPEKLEEGKKVAKERIERRMAGEVGVDMAYSTKSAYHKNTNENRILHDDNKSKILIAAHCFFDSPHSFGNNLFTDFYEWLNFLGKISLKTDYHWYIKTHPDFIPANVTYIKKIISQYPKINFIPSSTSHHQLISEGIDIALTVFGTIGFEYASLGKIVINASKVGPHSRYNFNFNPESIEEYEELLLKIPTLKKEIDKDKVYEYYFLRRVLGCENWFFKDLNHSLKEIGGYHNLKESLMFDYFIDSMISEEQRIIETIATFLESGDYSLSAIYFPNNKYIK